MDEGEDIRREPQFTRPPGVVKRMSPHPVVAHNEATRCEVQDGYQIRTFEVVK